MARLFLRLIVRPLTADKVRSVLMALAVTLGVAVVVAIDLASDAAAGSFRASMESLTGNSEIEVTATGGIDEALYVKLATLPVALQWTPRLEGYAEVAATRAVVPLIGLDLTQPPPDLKKVDQASSSTDLLADPRSIWASRGLGWKPEQTVRLTINDRTAEYTVRGVFDARDQVIAMDIGAAQQAMGKPARLDRIEASLPRSAPDPAAWIARLRAEVPAGVEVRSRGLAQEQNKKMLTGFRWNLRALSYISLVVGGFLIYNAIAVSVVRRRAEIGIIRALGMTRGQVLTLFLGEAALFGLVGGALGLALGRVMAEGAVKMLGATVEALYVSSRPGEIAFDAAIVAKAFAIGLAASLLAALAPAREASQVAPVEAMARGHRQHQARLHLGRRFAFGLAAVALALFAYRQDAIDGQPVFGYASVFLAVAANAWFMPAAVVAISRLLDGAALRLLGIEGHLAARSLWASVDRTAVLASALATAIAMFVAVGLMVGSFRETVATWMEGQLQADLYLRAAAGGGAGRYPTVSADVPEAIRGIDGVEAIDRFRVYEINYNNKPALLGGGDTSVVRISRRTSFMPGQDRDAILCKMAKGGDHCIVSEPFANKHNVRAGDLLRVPLGGKTATFEVLGIYFDYSSERGYIITDRTTLMRYLPDPAISSLAIYLRPGADAEAVRRRIETATAGRSLAIFSNRSLREEALRIFDRTFAITWALEAVAILVAVLGVAGALLALVIDRRREMALLRFLGAAARQVSRLILCEAALLGLMANAAGLALGYAMSFVLIYVINKQSFGWTMNFHWPVTLLLTALLLIYVATILAALYPARIAARLNPIEVIHEE
ncbi:MAG: ABC transporter permease [Acidobacteria bacterium]|nr:ABC transporter permease [Acidobacteriota bacterium]